MELHKTAWFPYM